MGLIGKALNLNGLYNKSKVLYRAFSRGVRWETNPRIAEIPLVLFYLGKYLTPPARILDVGYLESLLPYFLSSIGFEVVGVDIRGPNLNLKGAKIKIYKQDICEFASETKFDAVTFISTLEHIGIGYGDSGDSEKDVKALRKIYNLLKPNGLLFISVPMFKEFRIIENFERHYNPENFLELVRSTGFEVLEEKYIAKNKDFWEIEDLPNCLRMGKTFIGFIVCRRREDE